MPGKTGFGFILGCLEKEDRFFGTVGADSQLIAHLFQLQAVGLIVKLTLDLQPDTLHFYSFFHIISPPFGHQKTALIESGQITI